jgi:hypothetical protein
VAGLSPVAVAVIGLGSEASGNVPITVPGADASATFHPLAVIADPPSLVYVPDRSTLVAWVLETVDVPAHPIIGAVEATPHHDLWLCVMTI